MEILSTIPVQGSGTASLTDPIQIVFDSPIDISTVSQSSIVVINKSGTSDDTLFSAGDFMGSELSSFVEGLVSVNGDTITFTPSLPLSPDTKYTVLIPNSISDQDGNSLAVTYSLTFTTVKDDVIEPIQMPEGLTTILGKSVYFEGESVVPQSAETFRIIYANPKPDSFLVTSGICVLKFSDELLPGQEYKISIGISEILSDHPAELLVAGTDYTISIAGDRITINIISPKQDTIYTVSVDGNIKNTNDNALGDDYVFSYISDLSTYYSSTKIMRLRAGTLLSNIPDLSLALYIYINSQDADNIINKTNLTAAQKSALKSRYVLVSSLYQVLQTNISSNVSDYIRKQFADFSLAISTKSQVVLYNRLLDDLKKWLETFKNIVSGSSSTSKGFLRNQRITDIGRSWISPSTSPGINSKIQSNNIYYLLNWSPLGN